jgi:hypothetical protein
MGCLRENREEKSDAQKEHQIAFPGRGSISHQFQNTIGRVDGIFYPETCFYSDFIFSNNIETHETYSESEIFRLVDSVVPLLLITIGFRVLLPVVVW